MRMKTRILLVALALAVSLFALFAYFAGGIGGATTSGQQSIHLALGNPSDATTDGKDKDNYLMVKPYFALSYNNAKGTPNWVSWHLSQGDLGKAPRKQRFDTDTELPDGFTRITHGDYTDTGFDRGHMCPHGDRALDETMSYATFVMTNIVPQAHQCNAGAWESLEVYERYLAKKGKDLFIVAGPIGRGGTGTKGQETTVAHGKVTVPEKVFKVILVVDRTKDADPAKWVNSDARLIAVIMPNDTSVDDDNWGQYRCSVEDVEKATGLKFFTNAPREILAPLKTKVDTTKPPKLRKSE
jgi:endonuclease G